jgi:two-component system LytT family response regulator
LSKIRTIIFNDRYSGGKILEGMLGMHCPEIEVAGSAGSPEKARELISSLKPDLVFLDMNMPGGDGFSLLEHIPERNFRLIIASAYGEHAIRAVKMRADDYIVKPLCPGDLEDAVSNIRRLIKKTGSPTEARNEKFPPDKIAITHQKGFTVLELAEIVRLEGESNYSKIFLSNRAHLLSSRTLKSYEKVLSGKFIRIHKSHIINLDHLKEYKSTDGAYAVMKDNSKIMISRRKLADFLKRVETHTLRLK